jgi:hypothetical protein
VHQLRSILSEKLPESAVDYCAQLCKDYPFEFVLRKQRVTKLGDYRYDPIGANHTITVNDNLNKYQFLVTYVHEVAHRAVHQHRSIQKPHGVIWKQKFQSLMLPMLRPDIFPDDVLRILAKHMKNPKASVAGDPKLAKILSNYDGNSENELRLDDIEVGDEFMFRKRSFRKIEVKRTRAVCMDIMNHKRYFIPLMANVTSKEV